MGRDLRILELTATALVCLAFVLMLLLSPGEFATSISDWLFRWQTILAGVFALVGASWTVGKIREQISQVDRHRDEQLSRDHRAARAVLPLALSSVCATSNSSLKTLGNISLWDDVALELSPQTAPPFEIDNRVIGPLQSVIQTTQNLMLASAVAQLIRDIQICSARLRDCRIRSRREAIDRIIDVAGVDAIAASLFEYAREKDEAVHQFVDWKDLERACVVASMDEIDHGEVFHRLKAGALTASAYRRLYD